MPEGTEKPLYIWQDPENKLVNNVIKYFKKSNQELVVLHLNNSLTTDSGVPLGKYLLGVCHEYDLLDNKRTTFLSYKDHILALELCISRLRLKNGDKTVEVDKKDILECHEAYVKKCIFSCDIAECHDEFLNVYDEFLKLSNCSDLYKLVNILRKNSCNEKLQTHISSHGFILFGVPESEVFVEFIKLLSEQKKIYKVTIEMPLNISLENSPSSNQLEDVKICEEQISIDDLSIIANCDLSVGSATEEYAEEVILAFLSLLVNCRNELALSKAMISPIINLSHSAFTDLKHLSLQKDMSMCQTVMSYVTRIRLGGKGYAPPADCPLRSHLKALEQFVDLLNQLQTIIEEDLSGSAVKRIINIVKKRLLKSSEKFKTESIVTAAKELIEISVHLHKQKSLLKKTNQAGQESLDVLHDLVNHKSYCYKSMDAETILEQRNLKRTPLNLPPLLGYFRSPEEEEEEEESINEDTQSSIHSLKKLKLENINDVAPVISYFHHSESNSISKSCVDEKTPTKISFQGCLSTTEDMLPKKMGKVQCERNERQPLAPISNKNKLGTKRSLARDEFEIRSKKMNTKSKKQATAKQPKGKAQIKGQGSIMNFFIQKGC